MHEMSPAERYAASKARNSHPLVAEFEAIAGFSLDGFQRAACESLEAGRSVLVAAPTGAGKTIVAEFAMELAMRDLREKAFYTAPIKALSNQKYQELVERYGPENVGLLTGDTNINGDARIIVMTTEVLRNMIYAQSDSLSDLAFVILDEVHYLADKFRGAVWEEIILHLPPKVRLVSLSATVSNAEEFGDWLHTVRGDTDVIVSEHRPVPLFQHVLTRSALYPLFTHKSGDETSQAVINPEIVRLASRDRFGRGKTRHGGGAPRGRSFSVSRVDTAIMLAGENLLPAIMFIFSRRGCDEAVTQCLREGVRLTSVDERDEIRSRVYERTAALSNEDLDALQYRTWLAGLERGIAAHHAGMIPLFKEIVEELFQERLLKIVFATETLALGINMPARSVVIEKLDKFNGEARVPLTSGEFTQLTGRAGRRGIDPEGHAVVLWHDSINPDSLAHMAAKRSYPLLSSFKPTYNMSVNLIGQVGFDKARSILETSFAQFQADRATVDLAWQVKKAEESLAGYEQSMECHLGDFRGYSSLRKKISDIESGSTKSRSRAHAKTAHQRKRLESIQDLRKQLSAHPCHRCPEREQHERWAERWWRLRRQTDALVRQINDRTGSIARQFDRVTRVLLELGYLDELRGELTVSTWGNSLKMVFGERDLLVMESLRRGLWDSLTPAELAALVACLTYEPRREEEGFDRQMPKGQFRQVFNQTLDVWAELDELEEQNNLPQASAPLATISMAVLDWANGVSLERVLDRLEMSAGDFVRQIKQTIDLLEQIAGVAEGPLADSARSAKQLLKRGIVVLSTVEL